MAHTNNWTMFEDRVLVHCEGLLECKSPLIYLFIFGSALITCLEGMPSNDQTFSGFGAKGYYYLFHQNRPGFALGLILLKLMSWKRGGSQKKLNSIWWLNPHLTSPINLLHDISNLLLKEVERKYSLPSNYQGYVMRFEFGPHTFFVLIFVDQNILKGRIVGVLRWSVKMVLKGIEVSTNFILGQKVKNHFNKANHILG